MNAHRRQNLNFLGLAQPFQKVTKIQLFDLKYKNFL